MMRRCVFFLLAGLLFLTVSGHAYAQRSEGLYGAIQYSFPASKVGKTLGVKGGYRWYPAGPEQLFSLSTELSVNAAFPGLLGSRSEGETRTRLSVPLVVSAEYPLFPSLRLPFSSRVFPLYIGVGAGFSYFYQSYEGLAATHAFYPEWSPRLYLGAVGIEYHFRRDLASDLVLVGRFNLQRLRRKVLGGIL